MRTSTTPHRPDRRPEVDVAGALDALDALDAETVADLDVHTGDDVVGGTWGGGGTSISTIR